MRALKCIRALTNLQSNRVFALIYLVFTSNNLHYTYIYLYPISCVSFKNTPVLYVYYAINDHAQSHWIARCIWWGSNKWFHGFYHFFWRVGRNLSFILENLFHLRILSMPCLSTRPIRQEINKNETKTTWSRKQMK